MSGSVAILRGRGRGICTTIEGATTLRRCYRDWSFNSTQAREPRDTFGSATQREPAGSLELDALSVLRQSSEVPRVRSHVQREGFGGTPRRKGAGAHPAVASSDPLIRCRHGRCDRVVTADAQHTSRVPDRAATGGCEGDQSRRCEARARENARPVPRTSVDSASHYEPGVCRCTAIDAAQFSGCRTSELAGSAANRAFHRRVRPANREDRSDARLWLADAAQP